MEFETVAGVSLPAIGLGTMRQVGEACRQLVAAALSEGYRHLDTARKYGNEEDVGSGIRRSDVPRDEVLLVTKLQPHELGAADVRRATEESLRRLGTEYVDVLLVHWPNPDIDVHETLDAMGTLRDEGKTRFVGVANFPSAMLEEVAGTPGLIGNQAEYHPYLAQEKVLSTLRRHGLVLTAYCPLGRGGAMLDDPTLAEIAAAHERTVPQIVLRWLVQQDGVIAIPGTSSPDHLRDNLAVFDFGLSPEEMSRITALDRGERVVDPPHAPVWDA